MNTLRDLLIHELKDLYHAEKQLTKALPKMVKAAHDQELKDALNNHLEETKAQVERLEEALKKLDVSPRGIRCVAMEGIIAEGEEILKEKCDPAVRDAAIIAAAQRAEHYEIAGYGCASAFARQLGENEILKLLQQTQEEETAADALLSNIAESSVNEQAMTVTA
jgi:ferritin-like metal-binding protein YciE